MVLSFYRVVNVPAALGFCPDADTIRAAQRTTARMTENAGMSSIWIVNPFDPLPGDPEQPGRYASLARLLVRAGHAVTWWTASFSHRFKRELDQAALATECRRQNVEPRFVPTRAYSRNVSLARVLSHRDYVKNFARLAREADAPQVIIASNPPLSSPAAAADIARQAGARLIVDVQDIWVENLRDMLPRLVRPAWRWLLRPSMKALRRAYAAADAIVGVAGIYADEPLKYGRRGYRRMVIPLGIALEEFDAAIAAGKSSIGDKPAGEIWSVYSGSFSRNYDVMTVGRVAAEAARRRMNVRFLFSGRGELERDVRSVIDGLSNVTFLGFAPFADWAATVAQCDIGWNAVRPEVLIAFPNKIFYYWSAGLAVLNSIPGECADWLARTDTGESYPCGDVAGALAALERLTSDRARLARRRVNARRTAEQHWDRRVLYQPYVALIEELAESVGVAGGDSSS